MLREEALGSDEYVLNTQGVVVGKCLASPLVQRIDFVPQDVFSLCLEDPLDDTVVDGHADELAEDLAEEYRPRRHVHVVADLLVLQHVLCAVPYVACNGTVGCCTSRVAVAASCMHHEAVEQFVE